MTAFIHFILKIFLGLTEPRSCSIASGCAVDLVVGLLDHAVVQ